MKSPLDASDNEILEQFRETAGQIVGKPFPTMGLDSSISELGIDSISTMEIISSFETTVGVQISDEALAEIRTVRDFANAMRSALSTEPGRSSG